LAAGIGERLGPFTYTTPKALVEFEGTSITERCLKTFSELGVTEAAIVTGHFGDMMRQRLGDRYDGIKIRYFHNPFYAITGGAHSLWLARAFFEGKPSIIMDGDHLIDPRLIDKLIKASYENCMLVDDTQVVKKPTEEVIVVGRDGIIKRLAWSQTGELFRMVEPEDMVGEALIIVRLGAKASSALSYEVDRYLQEGKGGKFEIIEPLNNTFKRHDTWYLSTQGLPWIEIDFDYDLERARSEIFPAIKEGKLMKI
jgi:choline kinase